MAVDVVKQTESPGEVMVQPSSPLSSKSIVPFLDSVSKKSTKSTSKVMNVTISVLGLDGIIAKNASSKEKNKKKNDETRSTTAGPDSSGTCNANSATIVASFTHSVSTGRKSFLTHVPSRPVHLNPTASAGEGVQHVIHWPSKTAGDDVGDESQALSTLQFKRHFLPEDSGSISSSGHGSEENRFIPQTCPIHLSISRNGKLVVIGSANVIINGEEKGESSITFPVISSFRPIKSNSPMKKMRKKGKGPQVPMMKIKGDKFQFGLKSDSMLRVLVRVSESDADATGKHEKEVVPQEEDEANPANDTHMTLATTESDDSDCESVGDCESIEGASVERDDWEVYMLTQNELRHLRRELAKAESENKSLQMEMAVMRGASKQENERLCNELNTLRQAVKDKIDNLRQEMSQAKTAAEMMPIYEDRISELMDELKTKDSEVQCLKDEIEEVRRFYRLQVDSLLWDNVEDSELPEDDQDRTLSGLGSAEEKNHCALLPVRNMVGRLRKNMAAVPKDMNTKEDMSSTSTYLDTSNSDTDETTPENTDGPADEGKGEKLEKPEAEPTVVVQELEADSKEVDENLQGDDGYVLYESHTEHKSTPDEHVEIDESEGPKTDEQDTEVPIKHDNIAGALLQASTNVDSLLWDNDQTSTLSESQRNSEENNLSSLMSRIRRIRKKMVEMDKKVLEAREASKAEISGSSTHSSKAGDNAKEKNDGVATESPGDMTEKTEDEIEVEPNDNESPEELKTESKDHEMKPNASIVDPDVDVNNDADDEQEAGPGDRVAGDAKSVSGESAEELKAESTENEMKTEASIVEPDGDVSIVAASEQEADSISCDTEKCVSNESIDKLEAKARSPGYIGELFADDGDDDDVPGVDACSAESLLWEDDQSS